MSNVMLGQEIKSFRIWHAHTTKTITNRRLMMKGMVEGYTYPHIYPDGGLRSIHGYLWNL